MVKDEVAEMKEKAKKAYFDAEQKEIKSLKEIFDRTTQTEKHWIEELGCYVVFGHLSMGDLAELMQIEDKNKMGLEMLYRILKSADKTLKKEWVFGLPIDVATALINKLMTEGLGFQKDMTSPKVQSDT